jgi:hypothetical protein
MQQRRVIHLVAAAALAVSVLAGLSCAPRTICKDSTGGGVDQWCVSQHLGPGNEIWVHTRDGVTHHGGYAGMRQVEAVPTLLLLPYTAWGTEQRADTDRIELGDIQRINRIREGSTLFGLLVGAGFGVTMMLMVLGAEFSGMRS